MCWLVCAVTAVLYRPSLVEQLELFCYFVCVALHNTTTMSVVAVVMLVMVGLFLLFLFRRLLILLIVLVFVPGLL